MFYLHISFHHYQPFSEQAKQVMQVSLITMLVDLCDKTTFRNCQHSVQNIPIEYFSGRILLVGMCCAFFLIILCCLISKIILTNVVCLTTMKQIC